MLIIHRRVGEAVYITSGSNRITLKVLDYNGCDVTYLIKKGTKEYIHKQKLGKNFIDHHTIGADLVTISMIPPKMSYFGLRVGIQAPKHVVIERHDTVKRK